MVRLVVIPITTKVVVVVTGDDRCDHIGCQIISYESPEGSHRVWSCPRCGRVVRHDWKPFGWNVSKAKWTTPEVVVPVGNEGVATPYGQRAWKMPDAAPVSQLKKRGGRLWRL